jgi:hypothetical protein
MGGIPGFERLESDVYAEGEWTTWRGSRRLKLEDIILELARARDGSAGPGGSNEDWGGDETLAGFEREGGG